MARFERISNTVDIAGTSITAVDDGGVSLMGKHNGIWMTADPYFALVEAKRAFKDLHYNAKTETYTPVVSDETLAQCLGEALIARKGNRLGNE